MKIKFSCKFLNLQYVEKKHIFSLSNHSLKNTNLESNGKPHSASGNSVLNSQGIRILISVGLVINLFYFPHFEFSYDQRNVYFRPLTSTLYWLPNS